MHFTVKGEFDMTPSFEIILPIIPLDESAVILPTL